MIIFLVVSPIIVAFNYLWMGPSFCSYKTAKEACIAEAKFADSHAFKAKMMPDGRIVWMKPIKCFVTSEER